MGLTAASIKALISSKDLFTDKKVLSLGNPFFSKERLVEANIDKKTITEIFKIERDKRASYFFRNIFNSELYILDKSNEEGANYVYDLNKFINDKSLESKFDLIIDPGTTQHIFDLKLVYKNIFFLLKKGGFYFFQTPSNGWIDHGFRQYSPTFYFDLCFGNKESLSLNQLYVFHRDQKKFINLLPFFNSRELNSQPESYKVVKSFESLNLRRFTNTYFLLLCRRGGYLDNIGMIEKLSNKDLNFSINQQIYRIKTLGELLPNNEGKILTNYKKVNLLKSLFLSLPIPNNLKLKIIEVYCKYR